MENDFTDKYNTQLLPNEEIAFQQWAKANPNLGNTFDYDARGFWKAGAGQSSNGHGSDKWKKPNHPTFSDQSMYHGVDGYQGGNWQQQQNGLWSFSPSDTNLKMYNQNELQDYFKRVEPGNVLLTPVDNNPFE